MPKRYKIEESNKKKTIDFWGIKSFLNDPRIELAGNKEITIDGCLKVIEYEKTHIKLRLKKGHLTLMGDEFDIKVFENELIRIKGKISSLDFLV